MDSQRVPGDLTGHGTALTGHTGTVQPLWKSYDDEAQERMIACFGRPIEVSRHAGRWLARPGGLGQTRARPRLRVVMATLPLLGDTV